MCVWGGGVHTYICVYKIPIQENSRTQRERNIHWENVHGERGTVNRAESSAEGGPSRILTRMSHMVRCVCETGSGGRLGEGLHWKQEETAGKGGGGLGGTCLHTTLLEKY